MRLRDARLLARSPLTGPWFRAVRPGHFQTALAYAHTTTIPGRFNPGTVLRPAFPVLYLAEDQLVTLFEVQAMLGAPLPGYPNAPNSASGHWTIVQVDVTLKAVVDLTRGSQRRILRSTIQELTGDWRGYTLRRAPHPAGPPYYTKVPTQRLGSALRGLRRIEGFVTYSARVPTRRTLVVFPDVLQRGSQIRFTDPGTGQNHTIP